MNRSYASAITVKLTGGTYALVETQPPRQPWARRPAAGGTWCRRGRRDHEALEFLKSPLMKRYPQRAADIARPMLVRSAKRIIARATRIPLPAIERTLAGKPDKRVGLVGHDHRRLLKELRSLGLGWVIEEELVGLLSYLQSEPREQWGSL
jgi:hypothetical protein